MNAQTVASPAVRLLSTLHGVALRLECDPTAPWLFSVWYETAPGSDDWDVIGAGSTPVVAIREATDVLDSWGGR